VRDLPKSVAEVNPTYGVRIKKLLGNKT